MESDADASAPPDLRSGRVLQPVRSDLTAILGIEVGSSLLELALTHRSYAYEHGGLATNERLEFLGDSVLGLAVTDLLYGHYSDRAESDLARMRSSVVSTRALAGVARTMGVSGLGSFLLLGRGETSTGGADKDSILADSLEALIGAVFVQHGFEEAAALVDRLVGEAVRSAGFRSAGTDWKTVIQEEAAAVDLGPVTYRVDGSGPDHQRSFSAVVLLAGQPYGEGTGSSKKEAEQVAAAEAHRRLDDRR